MGLNSKDYDIFIVESKRLDATRLNTVIVIQAQASEASRASFAKAALELNLDTAKDDLSLARIELKVFEELKIQLFYFSLVEEF